MSSNTRKISKNNVKNKIMKKSQIFSLDTIFSTIIFIFILLSAIWAWHMTQNRINYVRDIRDMSVVAKNSMINLVTTRGEPSDWHLYDDTELNKTKTIGLSGITKGIIDQNKVDKLIYLGNNQYNVTKEILGVKGPGYEFYLEVGSNATGNYHGSARDVVVASRIMSLPNSSTVEIKMGLWR